MVFRLCQAYQSLPESGGVLDQDVSILRMHQVLVAGGYFEEQATGGVPVAHDPLAGIPMEAL